MSEWDAIIPVMASLITVLLTKGFDYVMAKRREPIDSFSRTTEAVDEIAGATTETIAYLRGELTAAREENIRIREESLAKDRIILSLSKKLADTNGKQKETT
jgi:hypothetical protein